MLSSGLESRMPIYEFLCRGCGHEFETVVLPSTTASCPACAGEDLERLVSGFAVSSEQTRQAAIKSAKRRDMSRRTEQIHAQQEYERDHRH